MKYLNTSLLSLSVLVSSAVLAQCDSELMKYLNSSDYQKTLVCKDTVLFQANYDNYPEVKFFHCGGVKKSPEYIMNYMDYLGREVTMPEPNLDGKYQNIHHQYASIVGYINKGVSITEICADYPILMKMYN